MRNLGFQFVGALTLAIFFIGCGTQKPSLEVKQDTLILIPKENMVVKDAIINNGECQAKRYAFNIDKSWEMAMERMGSQTRTLINAMMFDKREMMIKNTGLGKDYNESIYTQDEYNQVQASKKFNDLVKKCYDAIFPKAVAGNQVAKFDTNCPKITKVEIITEDDNFVYEF